MAVLDHDLETFDALDRQAAPQHAERHMAIPNGPAAAAVLATGAGSALYGIIVLLAESIESFKNAMVLSNTVGPLSGKSTFGVLAWLVVWGLLYALWRNRQVNFERVWLATLALVIVALVLTFPPFFMLFAID